MLQKGYQAALAAKSPIKGCVPDSYSSSTVRQLLHSCMPAAGAACMTHSLGRPAVLPEVLQQQARLDDPQAAAQRDFIRCAPCKALLHHWRFLPCPPVPP